MAKLRSILVVIALLAAAGGAGRVTPAAAQGTSGADGTTNSGTSSSSVSDAIDFILRPGEDSTAADEEDIWNWDNGEPGPSMLETGIGPPLLGPTGEEEIGPPLAGPVGEPLDMREKLAEAEAESDPFAATGIKLGSFVIRPSIEIGATATTNAAGVEGGPRAVGYLIAPEIDISSESERHSLDIDLSGEGITYDREEFNDRTLSARLSGRYDLTETTSLIGEGGYARSRGSFSNDNTPGGAAERPKTSAYDATLGLEQRFGRFSVRPSGFLVRELNDDVPLIGGGVASRRELDYLEYGGRLRAGYLLGAGIMPFTEVAAARRRQDQAVDDSGYRRSALWGELLGGIVIDRGDKLSGEVSLGYRHEELKDGRLSDIDAFVANASILWSPQRLTEVKVDLTTDTATSSVADESGTVTYSGLLTVSRKITPRVRLAGGGGVGYEYSVGFDSHDVTFTGFAEASYAFNRTASLSGRYTYDQDVSTDPGSSYKAHTVEVRLRLQR